MTDKTDVLIAGGGMAGLSQALALADSGLSITLVDALPAPASSAVYRQTLHKPDFADRVSALTPASIALLDAMGVWQPLQALRVCPWRAMQVWDADGSGKVSFSADELHLDALGFLVENRLLTCVLAEAAAQSPAITLIYEDAVNKIEKSDRFQEIGLKSGKIIDCSLLIGADGANSRVREQAGFALRHWSYQQRALVCTIQTEQEHGYTAWQRFMSSGPLAYLPLFLPDSPAQHYSSIVWSCDEALADELLALSDKALAQRIEQGLESRLGKVAVVSKPLVFPLQQQHARDYVAPGIALVGDAAHTIHPLAGQGINLGLADVQALTRVIKQALIRGEDYGSEQVLSRYQRARKPDNLGMMLTMEAFKRAFGSDDLLVRYLRNQGLSLVDRVGPLKRQLMKQAMGLNT